MIFPGSCFAALRLAFVNAAEPVKNTNRALSKLPSSTGWITVASPPASVKVPAASSSSSNRKSQPANLLSSSKDFSSAPRSEDAPAITIRWDSRSMEGMNHAVRDTIRWRKKRIRCNVNPTTAYAEAMMTSAYSEYRQMTPTSRQRRTMASDGCFRVRGMSLKLLYRMVLVINAPSPAASKNHATDHLQSCRGCLKQCTVEAIMPAAAGVGMPIKYFDPPGAIPCTLNRASLQAQQIRNAKQQTQPNSPIC